MKTGRRKGRVAAEEGEGREEELGWKKTQKRNRGRGERMR